MFFFFIPLNFTLKVPYYSNFPLPVFSNNNLCLYPASEGQLFHFSLKHTVLAIHPLWCHKGHWKMMIWKWLFVFEPASVCPETPLHVSHQLRRTSETASVSSPGSSPLLGSPHRLTCVSMSVAPCWLVAVFSVWSPWRLLGWYDSLGFNGLFDAMKAHLIIYFIVIFCGH